MYPLTKIVTLWALHEAFIGPKRGKMVKMAHWDNNLLNISLGKMVSKGKYEVFGKYIEEAMTENWISLTHIPSQGGSVLLYNGGSLLLYNCIIYLK